MLRVNIKHSKANKFREERKKAHWPGEKFLQNINKHARELLL